MITFSLVRASLVCCCCTSTGAIFILIRFLQASVATRFWCGAIFNYSFIANCAASPLVNDFWKSTENWQSYRSSLVQQFFWVRIKVRVSLSFKTSFESLATHQKLACHHVDTLVSYNQCQLLSSSPYCLHLAISLTSSFTVIQITLKQCSHICGHKQKIH